jgi:hypothetical protein
MPASPPKPPTNGKHFTPFRSAHEEAALKSGEEAWDNEGGHTSFTAGRIVRTPGAVFPYKVVMSHHGHADSARAFERCARPRPSFGVTRRSRRRDAPYTIGQPVRPELETLLEKVAP